MVKLCSPQNRSFTVKLCCSILLNHLSGWAPVLKHKKKQQKKNIGSKWADNSWIFIYGWTSPLTTTWLVCNYFYLLFLTLSTVICCGFLLVRNVLTVSRFGQKRLLNALDVNLNVNVNVRHYSVQQGAVSISPVCLMSPCCHSWGDSMK